MNDQPGVVVDSLRHSYGSKLALDDVGFTIPRGTFCALLGPNGAGKSTLFSLLTRLFVPESGTINIAGRDLATEPRSALARMGVVFQQPTLDLDLTVRQNMLYFAALHGISKRDSALRMEDALGQLGMAERASEKVRALNGGHRRRMEIARALLHKPDVLLLDEPTVGLDAETRRHITHHVHELTKTTGLTVLWATHLVDEVLPDDQLVVLHQGAVLAGGKCHILTGKRTLADTFASLTKEDAT